MYFRIIIVTVVTVYMMTSHKINTKPSSRHYKNHLPLFWKIAKKHEFRINKPKKYIFNGYPILLYKGTNHSFIAISDICIHKGASLSQGKLLANNCIQCPYHGWEFKNGLVENVPGCPEMKTNTFGVPRFETHCTNDDIYIRPTFDINSKKGYLYNHTAHIPTEANDVDFSRISGVRHLKRPHNLVTENVLDMMHISYVHSFGNSLAPVPFKIEYEEINELSGRTTFHYTAGRTSMSRILGGAKYVVVENEFHLPDVTVTRVKANDIVKTIVTHCYPIGKNESMLHFDLYRNFLTSNIFNPLFTYQMELTLDEDVNILNQVYDDYFLGFMNTRYDVTQMKYREKMKKLTKYINRD